MSGPFSVHQGNSIDIPFSLVAPDGTSDTTTAATVSSASGAVRVGVRPDNNRVVFVDGLSQTSGANVIISATEGGQPFSDSFLVAVQPPLNQGAVHAGASASAEYPTPASR